MLAFADDTALARLVIAALCALGSRLRTASAWLPAAADARSRSRGCASRRRGSRRPARLKAERLVHRKGIAARHAHSCTHVGNPTILTPLTRCRYLRRDDAPVRGRGQCVGDKERIATDLKSFIVGQIRRVAIVDHVGHKVGLDCLVKQYRLRDILSLYPRKEQVLLLVCTAIFHFLIVFQGYLQVARLPFMNKPSPKLWDGVDGVIGVMRSNQDVGVEQIEHGATTPLFHRKARPCSTGEQRFLGLRPKLCLLSLV